MYYRPEVSQKIYIRSELESLMAIPVSSFVVPRPYDEYDVHGTQAYEAWKTSFGPLVDQVSLLLGSSPSQYSLDQWQEYFEKLFSSQNKTLERAWCDNLIEAVTNPNGYKSEQISTELIAPNRVLAAFAGKGWRESAGFLAGLSANGLYNETQGFFENLGRELARQVNLSNALSSWVADLAGGMCSLETGSPELNSKLAVFQYGYLDEFEKMGMTQEQVIADYLPIQAVFSILPQPGVYLDTIPKSDSVEVGTIYYPGMPQVEPQVLKRDEATVINFVVPAAALGSGISRNVTQVLEAMPVDVSQEVFENQARWLDVALGVIPISARWKIEAYDPDYDVPEEAVEIVSGTGLERTLEIPIDQIYPGLHTRIMVQHTTDSRWEKWGESCDLAELKTGKDYRFGYVINNDAYGLSISLGIGETNVGMLRSEYPQLHGVFSHGVTEASRLLSSVIIEQGIHPGQVCVELALTSDPKERRKIMEAIADGGPEGVNALICNWNYHYPEAFPYPDLPSLLAVALSRPDFNISASFFSNTPELGAVIEQLGYQNNQALYIDDIFTIASNLGIDRMEEFESPETNLLLLLSRMSPYALYAQSAIASQENLMSEMWEGLMTLGARTDVVVIKPIDENDLFAANIIKEFEKLTKGNLFGLRPLASPQIMEAGQRKTVLEFCEAVLSGRINVDIREDKVIFGKRAIDANSGVFGYDEMLNHFQNDVVHTYMAFAQMIYASISFSKKRSQRMNAFKLQYEMMLNPERYGLYDHNQAVNFVAGCDLFKNVKMYLDVVPWDLGDPALTKAVITGNHEAIGEWVLSGGNPWNITNPKTVIPLEITDFRLFQGWLKYRQNLIQRVRG